MPFLWHFTYSTHWPTLTPTESNVFSMLFCVKFICTSMSLCHITTMWDCCRQATCLFVVTASQYWCATLKRWKQRLWIRWKWRHCHSSSVPWKLKRSMLVTFHPLCGHWIHTTDLCPWLYSFHCTENYHYWTLMNGISICFFLIFVQLTFWALMAGNSEEGTKWGSHPL